MKVATIFLALLRENESELLPQPLINSNYFGLEFKI